MDTVKPFRVVLTGGIASGKTTVANEFGVGRASSTPTAARDVVEPGADVETKSPSSERRLLDAAGRMDRSRMRGVFSPIPNAQKLEAITSRRSARNGTAGATAVGPYQIHAIPLFVEGGRKGTIAYW
jgi:dephospho-CoA kinase